MFRRKYRDILWITSLCLSSFAAQSFELDRSEGLFEAFPRVKAREQGRDQITTYFGNVVHTLGAEAQPEIAEVPELHDVAMCQLIWNDGEEGFYRSHHIRRAQRGPIACPFGKLAQAHSARRLDGGIVLLRRFAVAGSAPFDDVEFDGHGELLSRKGVQEEFYRQATGIQFSCLKGGCTVMKGPHGASPVRGGTMKRCRGSKYPGD